MSRITLVVATGRSAIVARRFRVNPAELAPYPHLPSNHERIPMTKTSKITLAVLGVLVVALIGGYIGAGFRGGSSGEAGTGSTGEAAFLQKIKDRGELRVGVALAPPMTAQQADGTLGGPNLIPLQELAKELNVKLTPVPAEWSNIVAGLQADRYDFAANLDATVERSLAIQFTIPVYEYQGVFAVKADSPYRTSADVIGSGQPIATAQGSAPEAALKNSGVSVQSIDNYTNAIATVKAGRAVAEFTDLPTVEAQTQADPSLKIIIPDPPIYSATANYGVPSSIDPWSMQVVNTSIQRAKDSGQLTQAYKDVNYFDIDNLPANLVKQ
jgi:ABC-type amino acid transport substrate-binding protein